MRVFTVSAKQHRRLQRFRRNTWMAIALCLLVRLSDAALGLGLIEANQFLAAQPSTVCAFQLESNS
jgi:hypothetical protein